MNYWHFKNVIDIFMATFLLILIMPIILLLTVLLAISFRESPFFFQERIGLHNSKFRIIKFKTMNSKCDAQGNLLSDTERLTKTGKAVRKTSLDELPQLINVIKGDMSFVGPRPLLPKYLPYYTTTELKRHHVKPGITGWVQVSGRNNLNWDDRLAKDVFYVENLSFTLDFKILIMTVIKVFKSDGVVVDPKAALSDLDDYRSS